MYLREANSSCWFRELETNNLCKVIMVFTGMRRSWITYIHIYSNHIICLYIKLDLFRRTLTLYNVTPSIARLFILTACFEHNLQQLPLKLMLFKNHINFKASP